MLSVRIDCNPGLRRLQVIQLASDCTTFGLVPGSSHVQDALGDTIPPAPPVLRSLFNLAPADAHFPEIFLMTSFQFCRGRPGLLLKPSGSHVRACRGSLWWSIRERCPSHLRRLHLIFFGLQQQFLGSPYFAADQRFPILHCARFHPLQEAVTVSESGDVWMCSYVCIETVRGFGSDAIARAYTLQ